MLDRRRLDCLGCTNYLCYPNYLCCADYLHGSNELFGSMCSKPLDIPVLVWYDYIEARDGKEEGRKKHNVDP